jgi:hypothetical protein
MKRLLAVAVVALATVAIYATVAPAGPQVVTPRQFSALSKRVTSLSKKLTNLTKEVVGLESCMGAVGIARFGDPNGSFGYLYDTSTGSSIYTSAIDVAPAESATAYSLVTDAQCASIFNGSAKAKAALSRGLRK